VRELSLFSGAGGGLLGTKLLGWTHVGYVEWDDYCQRVLAQRIADGYLDSAPIFGDVREFAQSGAADQYRGIADVVSAGFPCQPFSVAGKQAGADDSRNMWPATAEVIRRVQPRSVLLENVPGLISCGYLGTVLSDLAALGYVGRWGVLGAVDAGAPHKRDRLWIVGHASSDGRRADHWRELVSDQDGNGSAHEAGRQELQSRTDGAGFVADAESESSDGGSDHARIGMESRPLSEFGNRCGTAEVADANSAQRAGMRGPLGVRQEHADARSAGCWWATDPADDPESGLGRMAPRLAYGVDRLKAIGNGQVSAVAALAWRTLA
jgi:DNA (cytosine-5)-methyltransferase 1